MQVCLVIIFSFSRIETQNEAIIKEFLSIEKSALILPIPFVYELESLGHPIRLVKINEGSAFAIRFDAEFSRSNGFFICLLSKKIIL